MRSLVNPWLLPIGLAALMLGVPALGGEDDPVPNFETILKRFDGGPEKSEETAIQSEAEWARFIDRCPSESTRTKLRAQQVDFEKETVLAVAMGKNSSILGHPDYEKQAGVQRVGAADGKLVVEYCNVHSDHQDTRDRYPLHVVKVPKAKVVSFKKSSKMFGG